jgi:uncharacterized membrane protein YkoI
MKATIHIVAATAAILCISPAISLAQEPTPIREQSPGLLAQAKVAPAVARLTAFAELPGARIVGATIERVDDRLVYSFELNYPGHMGNEQVRIDATSGQLVCVEYCVELDTDGDIVMAAAPEIVADVRVKLPTVRETALASVPEGQVVRSSLRVQQERWVYVFDIEAEDGVVKRVLVNPWTGNVLSIETLR